MAWTTPKSWSVGEVVTAANMNTHLRDNLQYLKGLAGQIVFDNQIYASANSTGDVSLTFENTNTSSGTANAWLRAATYAGGGDALLNLGLGGLVNWYIGADRSANGVLAIGATGGNPIPGSSDWLRLDRVTGWLGLGLNMNPQGKLHVRGTNFGNLVYWDGVNITSAVTVLAAGSVTLGVVYASFFWTSSNTACNGNGWQSITILPGGSSALHNAGSDGLSLFVNTNGSVTVQRTSGSLSYRGNLILFYA